MAFGFLQCLFLMTVFTSCRSSSPVVIDPEEAWADANRFALAIIKTPSSERGQFNTIFGANKQRRVGLAAGRKMTFSQNSFHRLPINLFDKANSEFTIPATGLYNFYLTMVVVSCDASVNIELMVNGVSKSSMRSSGGLGKSEVAVQMGMIAGDKVHLQSNGGRTGREWIRYKNSEFVGYLCKKKSDGNCAVTLIA